MKKLLSLCVAPLLIAMTTTTLSGSQDRDVNEGMRGRFVRGGWPGSKSKVQTEKFTGLTVPG